MPRPEEIVVEGTVRERLQDGKIWIVTDGGQELLATLSGRAKRLGIRPERGDRYRVHVSLFNLRRGRIMSGVPPSAGADDVLSLSGSGDQP